MNKEFLQNLREQIKAGTVTEQEPMNKHTSFAIGGPADVFVQPATREEIRSAVYCAKEAGIPFFVMGNGSNLLVSDEGFRGMIIQIGKNFQAISVKDTVIEVQAGALLSRTARAAWNAGLTGFEFAAGIPGSVGGAVAMNFGEIASDRQTEVDKVAVGVDIRNGEQLTRLNSQLEVLCELGIEYEILFLDAEDETLVKRYKETRRTHPLAKEDRIETGISREREMISFIRDRADYIIDTTTLLTRELRQEVEKIFVGNEEYGNFIITVLSFGFKYGIPSDADLVFDVRFLPNPYYEQALRPLTGNDRSIQEYVMKNGDGRKFLDKLEDLMQFLIPRYLDEGKNSLVIGIGCTGGKHRSVTITNGLYARLKKFPYTVRMEHRDIEKDARTKGK